MSRFRRPRVGDRSAPTGAPALDASMIDPSVTVGSVRLRSAVMTASGTAGYGSEFAPYVDLATIGAVVTKSLAPYDWPGNPAPRLHPVHSGMMNSVGLQGPGVDAWLTRALPGLLDTGADVVCSIWGRSVEDYRRAAEMLSDAPNSVVAVEVNLSCPNLEGRGGIFAHDADLSAEVLAATEACGRPRWAKLSPNTDRIAEVARAVTQAGAEALTLVNTLLGLALDPETLRPTLGNGGGGLSGPAIHPIAVRAVADVRAALPDTPIVGVGGVATTADAIELMAVGASAVQIGTALFADPRVLAWVRDGLVTEAARRGLESVAEFTGLAAL